MELIGSRKREKVMANRSVETLVDCAQWQSRGTPDRNTRATCCETFHCS